MSNDLFGGDYAEALDDDLPVFSDPEYFDKDKIEGHFVIDFRLFEYGLDNKQVLIYCIMSKRYACSEEISPETVMHEYNSAASKKDQLSLEDVNRAIHYIESTGLLRDTYAETDRRRAIEKLAGTRNSD